MDLIHEWDYIHYLAGSPIRVKNMIRKKSNLEIDSDDIAVYIAEYEDKIVELHLDYFGREPVRRIELFTADDTIAVDLLCQRIKWMRAGKMIEFPKDRNEYQKRELEHFLDIACGKSGNDNPLDVACKVLRIARGEF